jgi:hypothetical protein
MTCNFADTEKAAPHPSQSSVVEEQKSGKFPCFGNPNKVAQRNGEGLIEPNLECVTCLQVSACLKKALLDQGVLNPSPAQSEPVKRVFGFLHRWSNRKRKAQKG